jgi:hypothetical protein
VMPLNASNHNAEKIKWARVTVVAVLMFMGGCATGSSGDFF